MTARIITAMPMRKGMHCKNVSVRDVDVKLSAANIKELMKDWTAYTMAGFLILRNGDDHAVIELKKEDSLELFKKVIGHEIISLPSDTIFVDLPYADVMNIPALAAIQNEHPGKTVVIKGMFSHMSFVSNMGTIRLDVIDNVPPSPSKLGVLVRAALATGFIEHPVIVNDVIIDMSEKVNEVRTEAVMFPCRVSGLTAPMPVYFLDEAPKVSHNVTLIGCDLSKRIYGALYKRDVPFINVCPMEHRSAAGVKTILKCCKIKEGHKIEGNVAKVPWGATIPEVVSALNELLK